MVNYVYYGRGDRANIRLGDEQVRVIIESRQRGRLDVAAELRRMADDDPIPGDRTRLGHLHPGPAGECSGGDPGRASRPRRLHDRHAGTIRQMVHERGSSLPRFEPDVYGLVYQTSCRISSGRPGTRTAARNTRSSPRHRPRNTQLTARGRRAASRAAAARARSAPRYLPYKP